VITGGTLVITEDKASIKGLGNHPCYLVGGRNMRGVFSVSDQRRDMPLLRS